jgi:hypothetical protein
MSVIHDSSVETHRILAAAPIQLRVGQKSVTPKRVARKVARLTTNP